MERLSLDLDQSEEREREREREGGGGTHRAYLCLASTAITASGAEGAWPGEGASEQDRKGARTAAGEGRLPYQLTEDVRRCALSLSMLISLMISPSQCSMKGELSERRGKEGGKEGKGPSASLEFRHPPRPKVGGQARVGQGSPEPRLTCWHLAARTPG